MDAVAKGVKSCGLGNGVALPLVRHHLPSLFLLSRPFKFLADNVEYP